MSETKRTVEGQVCRFCGRLLPLTYFPLKPGMKYARYKACRDCHPLGHSCIPKQKPEPKRRKFANDEERRAAQKEYQRKWRAAHRDEQLEKKRAKYWSKKGVEPPERSKTDEKCAEINENRSKSNENRSNSKPKRAKLTEDEKKERRRESQRKWDEKNRDRIREYQRRYYHEHKKKLNARSAERIKQTRAKRHAPFTSDEERKAHNKEYQRQWHEQHREEMKAKRKERHELNKSRSANLTERFYCSCCRCIKPAEDFITNGKQFRVCNECRARHTKKQELGQKPKSPHGTGERCEYHRQYWLEHKEDIKATRVEQAINRERKAEKKEPEDKLCWKCWRWPCFEGIENMDSDFAKEGCQSFHMKEDAS